MSSRHDTGSNILNPAQTCLSSAPTFSIAENTNFTSASTVLPDSPAENEKSSNACNNFSILVNKVKATPAQTVTSRAEVPSLHPETFQKNHSSCTHFLPANKNSSDEAIPSTTELSTTSKHDAQSSTSLDMPFLTSRQLIPNSHVESTTSRRCSSDFFSTASPDFSEDRTAVMNDPSVSSVSSDYALLTPAKTQGDGEILETGEFDNSKKLNFVNKVSESNQEGGHLSNSLFSFATTNDAPKSVITADKKLSPSNSSSRSSSQSSSGRSRDRRNSRSRDRRSNSGRRSWNGRPLFVTDIGNPSVGEPPASRAYAAMIAEDSFDPNNADFRTMVERFVQKYGDASREKNVDSFEVPNPFPAEGTLSSCNSVVEFKESNAFSSRSASTANRIEGKKDGTAYVSGTILSTMPTNEEEAEERKRWASREESHPKRGYINGKQVENKPFLPVEPSKGEAIEGSGDFPFRIEMASIKAFVDTMKARARVDPLSEGQLRRIRSPNGKLISTKTGSEDASKLEKSTLSTTLHAVEEGGNATRQEVLSFDNESATEIDVPPTVVCGSKGIYVDDFHNKAAVLHTKAVKNPSISDKDLYIITQGSLTHRLKPTSTFEENPPPPRRGRPKTLSPSRSNSSFSEEKDPSENIIQRKERPRLRNEGFSARIKVGPTFQVPSIPLFFLDANVADYTRRNRSSFDSPTLVYSPELWQQITLKRLRCGHFQRCLRNDFEFHTFLKRCARHWKSGSEWQPFSPEFAYKLLHKAEYDPEEALYMLSDPGFDFSSICDPPTRKYDNKWRPKDKRGQHPCCPYPPQILSKGSYLCRKTNAHALQY